MGKSEEIKEVEGVRSCNAAIRLGKKRYLHSSPPRQSRASKALSEEKKTLESHPAEVVGRVLSSQSEVFVGWSFSSRRRKRASTGEGKKVERTA